MYNFYSSKNKRILKIAETLILSHRLIPLNEISSLNACSIRTVYSDIEELKEVASGIMEIKESPGLIYSHTSSIKQLMLIKAKLIKNELFTKLLLLLYFNREKNLDIYELSLELQYSESHLRTVINSINRFIKCFGSEIINKEGYSIKVNNELYLATLVYVIMKNCNELDSFGISIEKEHKVRQFMFMNNIDVPEPLLRDLIYIHDLLDFSQSDTQVFFVLISNTISNFENLDINRLLISILKKYNLNINFKEIYKIKSILKAVAIKLALIPCHIDKYMNRYEYFYDEFSKENRYISDLILEDIILISAETGINFFEFKAEIIYYLYTEFNHLRKYKKLTIGVYSDLGSSHARSLINSIFKHFPHHEYFRYRESKDYDLVISNTEHNKFNDIDHIIVGDFISIKDIDKIYRKIYLL